MTALSAFLGLLQAALMILWLGVPAVAQAPVWLVFLPGALLLLGGAAYSLYRRWGSAARIRSLKPVP